MKKKLLIAVLCVAMMIVGGLATMAYLTDEDADINTFTVGDIQIELDEAKVDADGKVVEGADRVKGNAYHLLPGHTYVKDPTVHVLAKSEDSYVRMLVTVENIGELEKALPNTGETENYYAEDKTFLLQMLCNEWDPATWTYYADGYDRKIVKDEDGTEMEIAVYEFRYKEVVRKSETQTDLPALFESITVPGEIDNTHLAYLDAVNIVVEAHAIQADGFANADLAWAQWK